MFTTDRTFEKQFYSLYRFASILYRCEFASAPTQFEPARAGDSVTSDACYDSQHT